MWKLRDEQYHVAYLYTIYKDFVHGYISSSNWEIVWRAFSSLYQVVLVICLAMASFYKAAEISTFNLAALFGLRFNWEFQHVNFGLSAQANAYYFFGNCLMLLDLLNLVLMVCGKKLAK